MANGATSFGTELSAYYHRCLGPVFFEPYGRIVASRVASHAPRAVLETAAGTGIVTKILRSGLDGEASLVSTDLSEAMLAVAARHLSGIAGVSLRQADAQALPFADASFDAVVCQFGLMFFPDKDAGLREAFRVLVPGGRLHLAVWDSLDANPATRTTYETVMALYPSDPPTFFRLPHGCHRLDPLRDGLEAAGFTDVSIDIVDVVQDVPDLGEFARGLVAGTPMSDQIRTRGGPSIDAVTEVVTRALTESLGPPPSRVPLRAILFEARRPA